MEKNRKRNHILFLIVFILGGAGLGAYCAAAELARPMVIGLVGTWAILGCVAYLGIDILWASRVGKKLEKITPILTEEKDADRYIAELTALMGDIKAPQLRQVYLVNMGAAYCEKNDYYSAKRYLEQVVPKRLAGINRPVFWADMALVLFYLKETDAACRIMEDQSIAFGKLQDSPVVGGTIAIIHIFYLLAKGKQVEAKAALELANKKWRNPRTAEDLDYLAQLCA